MTPPEKARYPVAKHVRLRQVTSDVIAAYANVHNVSWSDAMRALLDIACAQYAGLLEIKFETEVAPPPSLSTVRRRKAKGIPVSGALVARARKVAKTQAAQRRRPA